MSYTTNPNMPRVRGQAVKMIKEGRSTREVARYFGFNQSTIVRWMHKASLRGYGNIPTLSSRPKTCPKALPRDMVGAIIQQRQGSKRCGQVIHQELLRKGIIVSLSSVQRTLERCHLTSKRSPWKRPHDHTQRPNVNFTGDLVQVDTIHIIGPDGKRIYIYTLIDLHSRWAYAQATDSIGAAKSVIFVRKAKKLAPFRFKMIQTDHGSEFSTWFTHSMWTMGINHRHSRVRQSNDNAHVERFNRTIQEECLDRYPNTLRSFRKILPKYLNYYNTERLHMGINYQTPMEVMRRS